jgi:hypothetical protein
MKEKRKSAEDRLERSVQGGGTEADNEDEDADCVYGLETKAQAAARSSLTTKSVVAVLLEQDMQWDDDKQTMLDPDLLADIYFKFSAMSQKGAHKRALKLEMSIRRYIEPSRWSPALKKKNPRRNSTMGQVPKSPRPMFERKVSAPAVLPSAAPIQPVRESSFRWRALKKRPSREQPSTVVEKPEQRRTVFAEQTPAPVPSVVPTPPVRESSFRWKAPKLPTRELSFRWRAPKQPTRHSSLESATHGPLGHSRHSSTTGYTI